jgi:hypothetical protein
MVSGQGLSRGGQNGSVGNVSYQTFSTGEVSVTTASRYAVPDRVVLAVPVERFPDEK